MTFRYLRQAIVRRRSKTHARKRASFKPSMEPLEARRLFAGDVMEAIPETDPHHQEVAMLVGSSSSRNEVVTGAAGHTTTVEDEYEMTTPDVLVVDAPGLLANDLSSPTSNATLELVKEPRFGVATIEDNGSFTYVPDAKFTGEDHFDYRIVDETGASNTARVTVTVPFRTTSDFRLFTDAGRTAEGLVGSYIDSNLRHNTAQVDWRVAHQIAGSRIDETLNFTDTGWGPRAEVGLTGGTDNNWEDFSVQWDGFVEILADQVRLQTRSDDGSRMWIDVNRDGIFDSSGVEFIDNNWGQGQGATPGPESIPLAAGMYPVRIQYEEGFGGNVLQLLDVHVPVVRVAYVVPSDREANPDAAANLPKIVQGYQDWYTDQMERYGFGDKTFRVETSADGVTPDVHVVGVAETAEQLRTDVWNEVNAAVQAASIPLWHSGQVWLLIPDILEQNPDGSIDGGVALGASFGSGADPGVAMTGGLGPVLAYTDPANSYNDEPYHGAIVPEIGPHELVQDVSEVWFKGSTFSSVTSSSLGAGLHELTHAFGIPHDFRNDANFHGNLMGNGLRGFRGWQYPHLYPEDDTFLSYGQALALNYSQYFNDLANEPESTKPDVTVFFNEGTVTPEDGQLRIAFSASDDTELAAALLIRDGDQVGEMPLEGTNVVTFFETPYYESGSDYRFEVVVYDVHGNRRSVSQNVEIQDGAGLAPQPHLRVSTSTPQIHQTITLDVSQTTDADSDPDAMTVEWDLDGDGEFDTQPSTEKSFEMILTATGTQTVQARLTDSDGNQSLSVPIGIRAVNHWHNPENQFDVYADGEITPLDVITIINHINVIDETLPLPVPSSLQVPAFCDVNNDGYCTAMDVMMVINAINSRTGTRVADAEFGGEVDTYIQVTARMEEIPLDFDYTRGQNRSHDDAEANVFKTNTVDTNHADSAVPTKRIEKLLSRLERNRDFGGNDAQLDHQPHDVDIALGESTARKLGLEATLRKPGQPKK